MFVAKFRGGSFSIEDLACGTKVQKQDLWWTSRLSTITNVREIWLLTTVSLALDGRL